MKRFVVLGAIVALFVSHGAMAATDHGPKLAHVNVDLGDTASLQRGARLFVNYCVSCHSAAYMRYNRIAADLGIPEEMIESSLMFTSDKVGDPMVAAMRSQDAESWFGVPPPDLSVIARSRGADWLYTFLTSFYLDDSRPTGVNNVVFPDTAMPHVLGELQGFQRAIYHEEETVHGDKVQRIVGLEPAIAGQESVREFRRSARDLVNFLTYVGEPARLVRYKVGAWVIAFLVLFACAAYLLKKEYWRDVH